MVQELVDGGSFLLNCPWDEKELENKLDEIYKKNAEIEDKVFEDNRITPVPYDDDSDTSKQAYINKKLKYI